MNWSEARITMFGFNDLTISYNYPNNLGDYMDIKWLTNGNDANEKLDSITSVSSIEIIGSNNFSINANAQYFILDAVRKDQSYNANINQSTVGGAGVNKSNGDPSDGTYFGHGRNENNHSIEGAYIANGSSADSYGYATWIR